MSKPKTLDQRLAEFVKQPGAHISNAEHAFISYMRSAAADGVGYGWMQQVIEWEWQSKASGALGPEYFNQRIAELERERDALREALRELVRLKNLHDRIESYGNPVFTGLYELIDEYNRCKPLAWDRARALLGEAT